jgi:hypothetical protein
VFVIRYVCVLQVAICTCTVGVKINSASRHNVSWTSTVLLDSDCFRKGTLSTLHTSLHLGLSQHMRKSSH